MDKSLIKKILIFVGIVVVFGLFQILTQPKIPNQSQNKNTKIITENRINSVSEFPTPTPDPTTNYWKEIKSEKFGFSFRQPNHLINPEIFDYTKDNRSDNLIASTRSCTHVNYCLFSVDVSNGTPEESLDQIKLKWAYNYYNVIQSQDKIISDFGVPGIKLTVEYPKQEAHPYMYYIFNKNNKTYTLEIYGHEEFANKIYTTFRIN